MSAVSFQFRDERGLRASITRHQKPAGGTAPMRERPILFSAPMVRAILHGRKTQTRRVVKPQPAHWRYLQPMWGTSPPPNPVEFGERWLWREVGPDYPDDARDDRRCPYGVPGDRLWVRETWALVPRTAYARSEGVQQVLRPDDSHDAAVFAADWERSKPGRWRPSIHMPRWASRITLEITGVRVERLQDISEADARAEGCPLTHDGKPYDPPPPDVDSWQGYGRASFCLLWSKINGPGSWDANPWVWVVEFKRVAA